VCHRTAEGKYFVIAKVVMTKLPLEMKISCGNTTLKATFWGEVATPLSPKLNALVKECACSKDMTFKMDEVMRLHKETFSVLNQEHWVSL
jgi:hypothetical protein